MGLKDADGLDRVVMTVRLGWGHSAYATEARVTYLSCHCVAPTTRSTSPSGRDRWDEVEWANLSSYYTTTSTSPVVSGELLLQIRVRLEPGSHCPLHPQFPGCNYGLISTVALAITPRRALQQRLRACSFPKEPFFLQNQS